MLASLNSKFYTVAALKEIADRMGLEIKGKVTKPVLAGIIADAIDILHSEALEINAAFDVMTEKLLKLAIKPSERKSFDERMTNRINGYTIQRNGGKLTAKQYQRIGKKVNARAAKRSK